MARPAARNRPIAHTRVPSNTVRSRPDHHPLDIHEAGSERTARTAGGELLDVLRDDQHSGRRRNRPQFAITKHRILASDADATTAWNVSRFPRQPAGSRRGRRAAAWLLSTRATVLPQILSQARATANGQDGCGARRLPREARHAATARSSSPGAASASAGWRQRRRYDQAVARTANTANTAAAQRSAAAQPLRGTFADNARDRKLVDELIGERRAEALAEDRAADARPRPGR